MKREAERKRVKAAATAKLLAVAEAERAKQAEQHAADVAAEQAARKQRAAKRRERRAAHKRKLKARLEENAQKRAEARARHRRHREEARKAHAQWAAQERRDKSDAWEREKLKHEGKYTAANEETFKRQQLADALAKKNAQDRVALDDRIKQRQFAAQHADESARKALAGRREATQKRQDKRLQAATAKYAAKQAAAEQTANAEISVLKLKAQGEVLAASSAAQERSRQVLQQAAMKVKAAEADVAEKLKVEDAKLKSTEESLAKRIKNIEQRSKRVIAARERAERRRQSVRAAAKSGEQQARQAAAAKLHAAMMEVGQKVAAKKALYLERMGERRRKVARKVARQQAALAARRRAAAVERKRKSIIGRVTDKELNRKRALRARAVAAARRRAELLSQAEALAAAVRAKNVNSEGAAKRCEKNVKTMRVQHRRGERAARLESVIKRANAAARHQRLAKAKRRRQREYDQKRRKQHHEQRRKKVAREADRKGREKARKQRRRDMAAGAQRVIAEMDKVHEVALGNERRRKQWWDRRCERRAQKAKTAQRRQRIQTRCLERKGELVKEAADAAAHHLKLRNQELARLKAQQAAQAQEDVAEKSAREQRRKHHARRSAVRRQRALRRELRTKERHRKHWAKLRAALKSEDALRKRLERREASARGKAYRQVMASQMRCAKEGAQWSWAECARVSASFATRVAKRQAQCGAVAGPARIKCLYDAHRYQEGLAAHRKAVCLGVVKAPVSKRASHCAAARKAYNKRVRADLLACTAKTGAEQAECVKAAQAYSASAPAALALRCRAPTHRCREARAMYARLVEEAGMRCQRVPEAQRAGCNGQIHAKTASFHRVVRMACAKPGALGEQSLCKRARAAYVRGLRKAADKCKALPRNAPESNLCYRALFRAIRDRFRGVAKACVRPTGCQRAERSYRRRVRVARANCRLQKTQQAKELCQADLSKRLARWAQAVKRRCATPLTRCARAKAAYVRRQRGYARYCRALKAGKARARCAQRSRRLSALWARVQRRACRPPTACDRAKRLHVLVAAKVQRQCMLIRAVGARAQCFHQARARTAKYRAAEKRACAPPRQDKCTRAMKAYNAKAAAAPKCFAKKSSSAQLRCEDLHAKLNAARWSKVRGGGGGGGGRG